MLGHYGLTLPTRSAASFLSCFQLQDSVKEINECNNKFIWSFFFLDIQHLFQIKMDFRSLTESQGLTPTSAIEKETQKTEIKGEKEFSGS